MVFDFEAKKQQGAFVRSTARLFSCKTLLPQRGVFCCLKIHFPFIIKSMAEERISPFSFLFRGCREYSLSPWQCPQFLFLLMGTIIIASILVTNFVARRYVEPEVVALIVLFVTGVLFIISYVIVSSFERIAESSRSKSEFISIMSHRLRAPLSGIKWKVDAMMSDKFSGKVELVEESIHEIRNYNERMISLVNDLLDLNRIEDHTVKLNPSSFSLRALVDEEADILKKEAKTKDLVFEIKSSENLLPVFADRGRIKNIVLHLLDNAVKYSTHGGVIQVSLESWQNGKQIRFSVRDQGIGVSEEDQKKVFSKFFRARNSLQYQTEGTGVGIYLAKKIVELSQGEIGFTSVEGKGSTFWFTLPSQGV